MRAAAAGLSLALALTLAPYVRRAWLPPATPRVTNRDGSRDRRLAGKARVRARRG